MITVLQFTKQSQMLKYLMTSLSWWKKWEVNLYCENLQPHTGITKCQTISKLTGSWSVRESRPLSWKSQKILHVGGSIIFNAVVCVLTKLTVILFLFEITDATLKKLNHLILSTLYLVISVLNNKTTILLNLAEYHLILTSSAYGLVG